MVMQGPHSIFILELTTKGCSPDSAMPSDAQTRSWGGGRFVHPSRRAHTLNGEDAPRSSSKSSRRYVIPMHFGTPVYDDLLTADEFLEESKKEAIKKYKTNELVIDPSAKPGPAPEISVLHWNSGKDK